MVDDEPNAAIDSVGQRLRAAREAKGLTIEDVASSTRIPTRHLLSLEDSDWSKLPASTYSVGFAKNYAGAVGLDRAEIADQLRTEMGSELPAHYTNATVENFEPVDGTRALPKGIVVGALVALVAVILLLTWLSNREISGNDAGAEAPVETQAAAPVATPATLDPVVITANDKAWIEVRDGATVLMQGELAAGQSFEVPATATAPTLTTAKPEALRISVGTGDAPPVGSAGVRVKDVSLLGPDLLRGPASAAAAAAAPAVASPAPRRNPPVTRRVATPPRTVPLVPPPVSPAPEPSPATNNAT
jgi:transcriptional regulator with XRE-family HTH domain